jgi:hypothetical protein
MKQTTIAFASAVMLLLITGCSEEVFLESPEGQYELGAISFGLLSDGSFYIEHLPATDDPRHYSITGTYDYTHEFADNETEVSYGQIDLRVVGIVLDSQTSDSLDVTDTHAGSDIWSGAEILGWWIYDGSIVYSGKMRLKLNVPATGYRPDEHTSPCDWWIAGDPPDCGG